MYNSNYTHTCNPAVNRPREENHKSEVKLSYKESPVSNKNLKTQIILRKKMVSKFRKKLDLTCLRSLEKNCMPFSSSGVTILKVCYKPGYLINDGFLFRQKDVLSRQNLVLSKLCV